MGGRKGRRKGGRKSEKVEKRFTPEKIWSHIKVFLKYDSELGFLKSHTHCNNHNH